MSIENSSRPEPQGRVAVLCLQRNGDLITVAGLLGRLRALPEVTRVELVCFDRVRSAADVLVGVDIVHEIPYNYLHRIQRTHRFAAFSRLRDCVTGIRGDNGFDTVINTSSTGFASTLASTFTNEIGVVFGPQLSAHGSFEASDPYSEYLNSAGTDKDTCSFALQDVYALAAGVGVGECHSYQSSPSDQKRGTRSEGRRLVAIHTTSSKAEKDWGQVGDATKWLEVMTRLNQQLPTRFVLLGHPDETESLQRLASDYGSGAEVFTESFCATTKLLAKCDGLVSVDTVSIHLAALVGCPSIVLRLGTAGGMAFVPGRGCIVIDVVDRAAGQDEPEVLTANDVARVCEAHFGPCSTEVDGLSHLRVLECCFTGEDYRSLRVPRWLSASARDKAFVDLEIRWQQAWWTSWKEPECISDEMIASLVHLNHQSSPGRIQHALRSKGALGDGVRRWARRNVEGADPSHGGVAA